MIDDRDDGNSASAVANQRSTSGARRRADFPERRAFGAPALRVRPAFLDDAWLPRFFIQSLFDVCPVTENRERLLTLMNLLGVLQGHFS
jgi:hypothetical protein